LLVRKTCMMCATNWTAAPDFIQMQCPIIISFLLLFSCCQGFCLLVCCIPLHLQFCNSHNFLFLLSSQDCVRQEAPKVMGNWFQGHSLNWSCATAVDGEFWQGKLSCATAVDGEFRQGKLSVCFMINADIDYPSHCIV
jgi:hypothetical protein